MLQCRADGCRAELGRRETRELAEKSLSTCTALAPQIGYDLAAKVAKKALAENKTVRQAALEMKVMEPDRLDKVLDLAAMTKPGL